MKSPYHHGNLKEALLVEAEKILVNEGMKGLTLRALAKAAGVSATAPYNHFNNKDTLLEALATEGFIQLRKYIDESLRNSSAELKAERIALGYINYALEHRQLFRLMFGNELSQMAPSDARSNAGRLSFEPIQQAVGEALQQANHQQLNHHATTQGAWSLVHGLATLIIDDKIALPNEPALRQAEILKIIRPFSLGVYSQPATG
ncbi:MAG: TetR/AcrR family transcriptional regulator [Idiomarina sp.]